MQRRSGSTIFSVGLIERTPVLRPNPKGRLTWRDGGKKLGYKSGEEGRFFLHFCGAMKIAILFVVALVAFSLLSVDVDGEPARGGKRGGGKKPPRKDGKPPRSPSPNNRSGGSSTKKEEKSKEEKDKHDSDRRVLAGGRRRLDPNPRAPLYDLAGDGENPRRTRWMNPPVAEGPLRYSMSPLINLDETDPRQPGSSGLNRGRGRGSAGGSRGNGKHLYSLLFPFQLKEANSNAGRRRGASSEKKRAGGRADSDSDSSVECLDPPKRSKRCRRKKIDMEEERPDQPSVLSVSQEMAFGETQFHKNKV